jgi:hypothetical protein
MIAQQLKSPLPEIPAEKMTELLAIKKRYGVPDPRLTGDPLPAATNSSGQELRLKAAGDGSAKSAGVDQATPNPATPNPTALDPALKREVDHLVSSVTAQLLDLLKTRA